MNRMHGIRSDKLFSSADNVSSSSTVHYMFLSFLFLTLCIPEHAYLAFISFRSIGLGAGASAADNPVQGSIFMESSWSYHGWSAIAVLLLMVMML